MAKQSEQLSTVSDLADLLRVKPATVYRKAKAGEIPHRKIGRAIRFSPEDIQAYLRRIRVAGAGE